MINTVLTTILYSLALIVVIFFYHEKKYNTLKRDVKKIEDENRQLQLEILRLISNHIKK